MVNPIFEWNPIYKDIDDDSESIWFGKTIFSNIPNTDSEVLVTVGEKYDMNLLKKEMERVKNEY